MWFLSKEFAELPEDVCSKKFSLLHGVISQFKDDGGTEKEETPKSLHHLGYQIALRNWIKEQTNSLKLYEK